MKSEQFPDQPIPEVWVGILDEWGCEPGPETGYQRVRMVPGQASVFPKMAEGYQFIAFWGAFFYKREGGMMRATPPPFLLVASRLIRAGELYQFPKGAILIDDGEHVAEI